MKKEERRIKLRLDLDKRDNIYRKLNGLEEIVNERVIPLMKQIGLEISLENILECSKSSDVIKNAYVKKEVANSGLDNPYLVELVKKEAAKRFDEEIFFANIYAYDDINIRHGEFLKLEDENLVVDDEAINEAATVYVTDKKELEAYDRHQKAVEVLNEFYNGKAPESAFELHNHFPTVDGKVKPGTWIEYKKYRTHGK